MPQVKVIIDGKSYRMACDEGQEKHLIDLAERFDRYVAHLKNSFGEIGDQRLTVMAGIMIMDELSELQKRIKGIENEISTLRKTRDELIAKIEKNEEIFVRTVSAVSERIEGVAEKISAS